MLSDSNTQNGVSQSSIRGLILFCLQNIYNLNVEIKDCDQRIKKSLQGELYLKKEIGFGSRSLLFSILNELKQKRVIFCEKKLIEEKQYRESVIARKHLLVIKRDKYMEDYFEYKVQDSDAKMSPKLFEKTKNRKC